MEKTKQQLEQTEQTIKPQIIEVKPKTTNIFETLRNSIDAEKKRNKGVKIAFGIAKWAFIVMIALPLLFLMAFIALIVLMLVI